MFKPKYEDKVNSRTLQKGERKVMMKIVRNATDLIFLKRFICLVEVHYHKVNLNSDNQILHVKFSLPTR